MIWEEILKWVSSNIGLIWILLIWLDLIELEDLLFCSKHTISLLINVKMFKITWTFCSILYLLTLCNIVKDTLMKWYCWQIVVIIQWKIWRFKSIEEWCLLDLNTVPECSSNSFLSNVPQYLIMHIHWPNHYYHLTPRRLFQW